MHNFLAQILIRLEEWLLSKHSMNIEIPDYDDKRQAIIINGCKSITTIMSLFLQLSRLAGEIYIIATVNIANRNVQPILIIITTIKISYSRFTST